MGLKHALILGAVCAVSVNLRAVEQGSGTYDTTAPTGSDISGWGAGWNSANPSAQTSYSGWDYVGTVNNASAVYLGNGWALTADHVVGGTATDPGGTAAVAGDMTLALTVEGTTTDYSNTGKYYTFTNPTGESNPVDLVLFQVSSPTAALPSLPPLTLATNAPTDYLNGGTGDTVGLIGYGGPSGRTWGKVGVTLSGQYTPVASSGSSQAQWFATDFYSAIGSIGKGPGDTQTNNAQLVSGDSGGGSFIFNSSTGLWELAGINNAVGSTQVEEDPVTHKWQQVSSGGTTLNFSASVQISTYEAQIAADLAAAPEPPAALLLLSGAAFAGAMFTWRRRLGPLHRP